MRKIILNVHTSLDGFVAGTHGELSGFDAGEDNLQFVCDICKAADTAMFGKTSYQLLNEYWPTAKDRSDATKATIEYSNWYNNAIKIVVSKTLNKETENTIIINGDIKDEITKVKQQAGKDIVIFGSPMLAQQLMQFNLIDVYWIFVNPSIFGKGISLFKELSNAIKLNLTETKQFINGELALRYDVKK